MSTAAITSTPTNEVSALQARLIQVGRALAIFVLSIGALLEAALRFALPLANRRYRRACWLHRWCRVACAVLGLRVRTEGALPRTGLLVSNHLSYLDIIAFSSLRPCVFVAKSDVAGWPLFGWVARAAGTIFVDRTRRCDSVRAIREIQQAISDDLLVVLFPEGTSSDGTTVLPFKSALLEPAVGLDAPIAVAAIDYSLDRGSIADEVCYWRDMVLAPHLWNLCGKSRLAAAVRFAALEKEMSDRKQIAKETHSLVRSLRIHHNLPPSAPPSPMVASSRFRQVEGRW